uniref:Apolipophorins n=1 Tax=Schistocephalus solidus TaxID=70667 RepID=A0A0V0J2C1_SCHSO
MNLKQPARSIHSVLTPLVGSHYLSLSLWSASMRPWDVVCLIAGLQWLWSAYSVGVSAKAEPTYFICSTACSEQKVGPTFAYNFSIQHRLTSTVNEEAGLTFFITGTAAVQGYAGCNYELRLQDVEFREMGEHQLRQSGFELKLSQNPLRFALSTSGLISDVCPVAVEGAFALNIKLAILSHLQWTKESDKVPITKLEDDISGRCVTHYTPIHDAEGRVLIKRTKSLSECSRRFEHELTMNSTDPSYAKALMELMTVSGVQTCDLSPEVDGFLSSLECTENLTIAGGVGAGSSQINTLSITSKFVRLPTTKGGSLTPDRGITFRRTAFAPSLFTVPTARREYREVNEAVILIAVMLRTDNWSGAANFIKLIEILRSLSLVDYNELYFMFATDREALQIIFQAAVYVKTEDAFTFLKTGISGGYLTAPLVQLSLIEAPSLKQIEAIKEALLVIDFKTYALVTSTLVDKFCRLNKDCLEMPPLRSILEELQSHLGPSCSYGDEGSMYKVLFTLRAIGNLGKVTDGPIIYPTIAQCLTNRHNDVSIRASAAESFRKFGCDEEIDTILMESMNDVSEDTEVRLQAYRSWARCLTTAKLKVLADLMRKEKSQQFRSFVAQHLQSLLKSDDLFKRHNVKMNRKEVVSSFGNLFQWIPMDWQRYSSYFAESFTDGKVTGKVEAITMAGALSPVPRYASINISINLKGREFNPLEFGYRSTWAPPFANIFFADSWELALAPEMIGLKENITQFDHIVNQKSTPGDTTALFVRFYGHEIAYTAGDTSPTAMSPKKPVNWLSEILLDENVQFVTSGGLSLQTSILLATANRLSTERALPNSILELDTRLSLELQSRVAFVLPNGPTGFRTEDHLYANLDFGVTLSAATSTSRTQFAFNYRGSDPKKPMLKYTRKVTELGYQRTKTVKPTGEYLLTTAKTPKLLDSLLGLVATYEQSCLGSNITEEGLCISRELTVEKNDGVALTYSQASEVLLNRAKKSLRVALSRPQGLQEVPAIGSLLNFEYEYATQGGKTDLSVRATAPWKETYRLQVSKAVDGKYKGSLELGSWRADIDGAYNASSPSQRYATFNLRSETDQVRAIYNSSDFGTYSLRAVGKGTMLVFSLKSKSKYLVNADGPLQQGDEYLLSQETEFWSPSFGEFELEGMLTREQNAHERRGKGKLKLSLKRQKWTAKLSGRVTTSVPIDISVGEPTWQHMLSAKYEQTGMKSLTLNAGSQTNLQKESNLMMSKNRLNSTLWLDNTILPQLDFRTVFLYEIDQLWNMDKVMRTGVSLNFTVPAAGIHSRFGVVVSTRELYIKLGGSSDTMRALTLWAVPQIHKPGLTVNFSMTSSKRLHQVILLLQAGSLCDYKLTSLLDPKARQHILNITSCSRPIMQTKTSFSLTTGPFIHFEALTDLVFLSSAPYRLQTSVQLPNGMQEVELNQSCFRMDTVRSNLYTTNASIALLPGMKIHGKILVDIPQLPSWTSENATTGKSDRLTVKYQQDGTESVRCSFAGEAFDRSAVKFNFKVDRKQPAAGDVSVMLALIPGQPSERFKGIFYKSTSQYAFTETEKSCSLEGEWNGNRGYAPGMPFRFGIKYTHEPDFRQGSINVFAEDTNLGYATDFELAEALYEYNINGPADVQTGGAYRLRSEYMLNWRRYLSRGVAGTQGFLHANLSQDFREGDLIFGTHLTNIEQSSLEVIINYLLRKRQLLVTSSAQLDGSPVYTVDLSVDNKGGNRTVGFSTNTTKIGNVEAFNLTAECTYPFVPNKPCQVMYRSATREACIASELTKDTRLWEISWNRLSNGSVILTTSENEVILRTPVRDIGLKKNCSRVDAPCQYRVYTQRQSTTHFLQISFGDAINQTELQSNLLKKPIFVEITTNSREAEAAIYRGMLGDHSDPIALASYEVAYSGTEESKHHLRLEKGGKVYTFSAVRTLGGIQVKLVGNFSIDGKEGTYDFLYIPDRLFRGNVSGPLRLQMEMEGAFGLNTGQFILSMKSFSTQGSWFLQKNPPVFYVRVDNGDTKQVYRATVKTPLNVSAEHFSWLEGAEPTQNRLTLNARFQSEITSDGVFKTRSFIHPLNALKLVLMGFETAMNYLDDGLSAYFDEGLKPLLQTQMKQLLEEVNQTAVLELYHNLVEDLMGVLQTLQAYQGVALPIIEQLGRQTDGMILWVINISRSGHLSRFSDVFYEIPTSLVEKIRSPQPYMDSFTQSLQRLADDLKTNVSLLVQNICSAADRISQRAASSASTGNRLLETLHKTRNAVTAFWTNNVLPTLCPALESIRLQLPTFKSAQEYMANLAEGGLDMMRQLAGILWSQMLLPLENEFGPTLRHVFNGDVKKRLEVYVKPELASFEADWGDISVNTTLFLPLSVQENLCSLVNCRNQFKWLEWIPQHVLRELKYPAGPWWSSKKQSTCNYNAWLFLPLDGRIHSLTFDGDVQSFVPKTGASYLLLRDFSNKAVTLTIDLGHNESYFNLFLDGGIQIRLKDTGEPGKVYRKTCKSGNVIVYKHKAGFWSLSVYPMRFQLLFDIKEGVLRVTVGCRWHGHLLGLLGSNDLEAANDRLQLGKGQSAYDISSWQISADSGTLTILSPPQMQEKGTSKASEVDQIFKERLQCVPAPYVERYIQLAKAGSASPNDTHISRAHVTRVLSALNRLREDKCPPV